MTLVAGPASTWLAIEVAELLQVQALACECQRSPDGETQSRPRRLRPGGDIYVIQSTSPPVDQHLVELLLLADACRRAGAARLTGVIPYCGYARQERRTGALSLHGVDALAHADQRRLLEWRRRGCQGDQHRDCALLPRIDRGACLDSLYHRVTTISILTMGAEEWHGATCDHSSQETA